MANDDTIAVASGGSAFVAIRAVTLVVAGRSVHVDVPRFVIGSGPTADLQLADKSVSREHLTIMLEKTGVRLRDDGSRNGTWIGTARITEALLTGESTVRLGQTSIDIRLDAGLTDVPISEQPTFGGAIGRSTVMRHLFATLERAARSDMSVLVEGESGVGKEVLARALHLASPRAQEPYIVVDCGAISTTLLESELFGHVKGAFTGASSDRIGLVQQADGGTLFLDEIGELPLEMQPKLLRLLEQREVRPIGSNVAQRVDVRVVSATNRSLAEAVAARTFREDLFYRLAVAHVHVPPLRDRKDDIEPLAELFLSRAGQGALPAELLSMFRSYRWPGNVRELRNVVERYAHLGATAPADLFGVHAAGTIATRPDTEPDAALFALPYAEARKDLLDRFEQRYFTSLLTRTAGVMARAAEAAGIARPSLYRILERIGISPPKKDGE